jgi:hypothetical protein
VAAFPRYFTSSGFMLFFCVHALSFLLNCNKMWVHNFVQQTTTASALRNDTG